MDVLLCALVSVRFPHLTTPVSNLAVPSTRESNISIFLQIILIIEAWIEIETIMKAADTNINTSSVSFIKKLYFNPGLNNKDNLEKYNNEYLLVFFGQNSSAHVLFLAAQTRC